MKCSLGSSSRNQLENIEQQLESLQRQLDVIKRSSSSFHQQLETARNDFNQEVNKLQRRLKTLIIVCSILIVLAAVCLSPPTVDWSHHQQEHTVKDHAFRVEFNKEVALKRFNNGIDELRRAFPGQTARL